VIDLHHGDCLDLMRDIPDGRIDAVITDPPYGNKKYMTDIEFDAGLLREWVKLYPSVAIFGYPEQLIKWCVSVLLVPDEWVTWWPTNKVAGRSNKLPKECECIAIFGITPGSKLLFRPRVQDKTCIDIHLSRGNSPTHARMGDVWRDAAPGMGFNYRLRLHPNQKPLTLMDRIVRLCTNEGDTVADPFMGSGTTGVACIEAGRRFIGIEKSEEYFAVAERRLADAAAKLHQLELVV